MKRLVVLLVLPLFACTARPLSEAGSTSARACKPSDDQTRRAYPVSPESRQLEPYIYPLIAKVIELPHYSHHWLEHGPRWQFAVAFTKPPSLASVQRLAPPPIRDRITVRTAKLTRAQIAAGRNLVVARLRTADLKDWSSGYNPTSQCFQIDVATTSAAEQVRALLPPDILIDSEIRVIGQ